MVQKIIIYKRASWIYWSSTLWFFMWTYRVPKSCISQIKLRMGFQKIEKKNPKRLLLANCWNILPEIITWIYQIVFHYLIFSWNKWIIFGLTNDFVVVEINTSRRRATKAWVKSEETLLILWNDQKFSEIFVVAMMQGSYWIFITWVPISIKFFTYLCRYILTRVDFLHIFIIKKVN